MNGSVQDLWHTKDKRRTARYGTGQRWRARLLVDGREVSRSFPTKEQAKQWLTGQQAALNRDEWISPKRGTVTFREVAEVWLARPNVRESTRERDASYLRSMILPRLGAKSVRSIEPDDLDQLVRDLQKEGKAPATVRKASQITGAVLEDAVRRKRLNRSPHRGVRLPALPDEEMMFLTAEQIHQVADELGEHRGMALLGGFGGLRLGEVIGLKGEDVDRATRAIRVRRTATETSSGVTTGPPKTRAAIRTVSLPGWVVDGLPDHSGWLFPDSRGGPMRDGNWRRRSWRPAVESAGFSGLRFHDLRHSHVALLISMGTDPKTIAARLGHKSVRVVLDHYGHLYESADRDVADQLERFSYGTEMAQVPTDS